MNALLPTSASQSSVVAFTHLLTGPLPTLLVLIGACILVGAALTRSKAPILKAAIRLAIAYWLFCFLCACMTIHGERLDTLLYTVSIWLGETLLTFVAPVVLTGLLAAFTKRSIHKVVA